MASVFKQLGQISMVVEDVMETAKIWNDEYGIGHGPGIHHIAFVTPHGTFNVAKEMLERKGIEHAQGGKDPMGQEFAYYNLCKQLGCFIELNDRPDDFHPLPPEEQYPEK